MAARTRLQDFMRWDPSQTTSGKDEDKIKVWYIDETAVPVIVKGEQVPTSYGKGIPRKYEQKGIPILGEFETQFSKEENEDHHHDYTPMIGTATDWTAIMGEVKYSIPISPAYIASTDKVRCAYTTPGSYIDVILPNIVTKMEEDEVLSIRGLYKSVIFALAVYPTKALAGKNTTRFKLISKHICEQAIAGIPNKVDYKHMIGVKYRMYTTIDTALREPTETDMFDEDKIDMGHTCVKYKQTVLQTTMATQSILEPKKRVVRLYISKSMLLPLNQFYITAVLQGSTPTIVAAYIPRRAISDASTFLRHHYLKKNGV